MKSVINKDGKFICTFEGGEINMDDPAFEGCEVIEGDAPLKAEQARMAEESEEAMKAAEAERDEEHKHLHDLEERINNLEELIKTQ